MSLKRGLAAVFAGALASVLGSAAFDRRWPNYSTRHWLLLVIGCVVIALAFQAAEAVYRRKKGRSSQ